MKKKAKACIQTVMDCVQPSVPVKTGGWGAHVCIGKPHTRTKLACKREGSNLPSPSNKNVE